MTFFNDIINFYRNGGNFKEQRKDPIWRRIFRFLRGVLSLLLTPVAEVVIGAFMLHTMHRDVPKELWRDSRRMLLRKFLPTITDLGFWLIFDNMTESRFDRVHNAAYRACEKMDSTITEMFQWAVSDTAE